MPTPDEHPPVDLACTECGAMMQGEQIDGMATEGLGARFAGRRSDRRIHLTDKGTDRGYTVAYECPDCNHRWTRFPPGHRLHDAGKLAIATAAAKAWKRAQGAPPP